MVTSNGPLMNEWSRLMKSSGRESLGPPEECAANWPLAIDEPTIKLNSVINVLFYRHVHV